MQESTPLTAPDMRPYRDNHPTNPDLNDFYAGAIPPPHRLSEYDSPYPPSTSFDGQRPPAPTAPYDPYSSNMRSSHADLDSQQNAGYSSSHWLEKQEASSKKSKWIVISSALLVIIVIAVGVGVGVGVSQSNKKSSNNLSSSNGGGNSANGAVNQTNPSDPSTFEKDSRLKHSFYGLAYTPNNVQYPNCNGTLPDIIEDIQLMSQLTSRIRLYGSDCNISSLVLEAIKQTKVDMTVYLGNYPDPGGDYVAYERQRDAMKQALQTYGADHVSGVTVGNEYMLNYLNSNGATDPNSAIGNVGAQNLIVNITDTKNMIAELGLKIPVGNSDAGSYFSTQVLSSVDYGLSNVHPWFANVSIDQAAGWTWDFFQENNVVAAQALSNNPTMYIAETGWPTESSDAGNANNGPSLASEANLDIFMQNFVCQANTNGTKYFFFEFFDEKWKDLQFGGVEGHWGLFHQNKTLKNINIPDCTIN